MTFVDRRRRPSFSDSPSVCRVEFTTSSPPWGSIQEVEIQTELDGLNSLLDVLETRVAAGCVDERHVALTEPIIVVFELDRPSIPKRPFNANARRPAEPGLQALETVRRPLKDPDGVVLVARPGRSPFDVTQPAIPCVSQTPGHATEVVRRLFECGGVAWNPQRLRNTGAR